MVAVHDGALGSESDDRVLDHVAARVPHVDTIADREIRDRHNVSVEVCAELLVLWLALVDVPQHLIVIIAIGAIIIAADPLHNRPTLDDVDAVVAGVHLLIGRVDVDTNAEAVRAEIVAQHLAEAGVAVCIGLGRAEPAQGAIVEERADAISPPFQWT